MKKKMMWVLVIVAAAVGLYFAIPKDPMEAARALRTASLEMRHRDVDRQLMDSMATGDFDQARDALDRGADIDFLYREQMGGEAWTPLMMVARVGYLDGLRFLLEAGADPNVQKEDGWAALHFACKEGHAEIARVLLEVGADPSIPTNAGETARSIAESSGNEELATLFEPSGS